MTIDKIKSYMNPVIWNHWSNCNDLELLRSAKSQLECEIKKGILTSIQYIAELELLKIKLTNK